jgi:selenocysteine-specific elongation factor
MKHLIIGTAGHVDHGKTALIKAMTNIDCDTHKEEKERGITINLGFSHLNLPSGESLGIIDVPGHKDFIKTMVAGAFGIDIVMLVVAADSGIMPQTREHLQIIEMLGIENGLVVLTKIDMVDEEMRELAELEITEFLEGTKLEDAPIIPVSSISGEGIDALVSELTNIIPKVKEKKKADHFRMFIDRIFNVKGIGFVVTGSVLEGKIEVGKDLYLLPGKNKKIKIRNIERHGEAVNSVDTGDRAAINLAGLKLEDYQRGMILSNKQLPDTSMIDSTFTLFSDNFQIGLWSKVIFYCGTFECAARMHLLDKDKLEPGETAIVQIHMEKPAVLLNKDKFIIRNSSNTMTMGGGDIIDVQPLHHKKRTPKLIEALQDLADATLHSDKRINLIKIEIRKLNKPVLVEEISKLLGISDEEVLHECKEDAKQPIKIISANGRKILVNHELHNNYQNQILEILKQYHQKNYILVEGMETKEFYGKLGFAGSESGKLYIDALMSLIAEEGLIKKSGITWTLTDHEVKIDPKTTHHLQWLEQAVLDVGLDKPVESELADLALGQKIKKDHLKMMLRFLGQEGKIKFHEGEFVHSSILDKCKKITLQDLKDKERGINEKEYRVLLNGTKKFSQMILGFLIAEELVYKPTFYIMLTEKGKSAANLI